MPIDERPRLIYELVLSLAQRDGERGELECDLVPAHARAHALTGEQELDAVRELAGEAGHLLMVDLLRLPTLDPGVDPLLGQGVEQA